MAVGERREFFKDFPPPVAIGVTPHGQFERGFSTRPTPHRRPVKQTPAQGVQLAFLQLSQPPLQEHAQIVGGNRQMMERLCAPEVVDA